MKKAFVLIDFDNFIGSEVENLTEEQFEYSLSKILKHCISESSDVDFLEMRLYGGWYMDTELTKQASIVQQLLTRFDLFPIIMNGKRISGSINLASSMFSFPDLIWRHLYKERRGVSRIRIAQHLVDDFCTANRGGCPKYLLNKFTKKKDKLCPVVGCEFLQNEVFISPVQKMVDTLIACDLITIAECEESSGIFLFSDDQDHLPSLALASIRRHKKLKCLNVIIQNETLLDLFEQLLKSFNIKLNYLP